MVTMRVRSLLPLFAVSLAVVACSGIPLTLSSVPPTGLPPAGAGRVWLVYALTGESQEEVLRMRDAYRSGKPSGGVNVSAGIEQDGLAVMNPALAATAWQSWLRTSRKEGFFELWSGTAGDLLKSAQR
jgi:hypothetical protein